MTEQLDFFGLKLPASLRPPFQVGEVRFTDWDWDFQHRQLDATAQIGTSVSLVARIDYSTTKRVYGFLLSDRGTATGTGLKLDLGGTLITGPVPAEPGEPDRLRLSGSYIADARSPLELAPSGWIQLHLEDPVSPALEFAPGAFTAHAFVRRAGVDPPVFKRTLPSIAATLRLGNRTPFGIGFDIARDNRVPLHGRLVNGKVAVPLEADDGVLQVRFDTATGIRNVLRDLWVEPRAGGELRVRAHAHADLRNSAVEWRAKGGPLRLSVRPGFEDGPATLLVAPCAPVPDCADLGVSFRLDDEGAKNAAIHGPVPTAAFRVHGTAASIVCDLAVPSQVVPPKSVGKGLLVAHTLPWLRFRKSATVDPQLRYPKRGRAHLRASGGSDIETLKFSGPSLALPLLPAAWTAEAKQKASTLAEELDAENRGLSYERPVTVHETALREAPHLDAVVRLERVFVPAPEPPNPPTSAGDPAGAVATAPAPVATGRAAGTTVLAIARPEVVAYPALFDYGIAKVTLPAFSKLPDYELIEDGRATVDLNLVKAAAALGDFQILGQPKGLGTGVFGIVKLSREISLTTIWEQEDLKTTAFDIGRLPATFLNASWTGVILFGVRVGTAGAQRSKILRDVVPAGLDLSYVAATPERDGRFSIAAQLDWKNEEKGKPYPGVEQMEVRARTVAVKATWYDSALTFFYCKLDLFFKSLLATGSGKDEPLTVIGSLDAATDTIRFAGALPEPEPLLTAPVGIIEQVFVSGVALEAIDGVTTFSVDGSLKFKSLPNFDPKAPAIFQGLQIALDGPMGKAGQWLKVAYGSLSLPLSIPVLSFRGFNVLIDSLAVSFDGKLPGWENVLQLTASDLDAKSFSLGLRVDIARLPLLSWKGFDLLSLDLHVACDAQSRFRVGIGFRGFNKSASGIELDLLRFLRLRVERIATWDKNGASGIQFQQVSLEILDKPIVDKLSFIIASGPNPGFLVFLPQAIPLAVLKFHWLLIARNIGLAKTTYDRILELRVVDPAAPPAASSTTCPKATDKDDAIILQQTNQIADDIFGKQIDPQVIDQWLFGAGFTLLELLKGKCLFQDGYYYGATLEGPLLCEWFGWDLAIGVIYAKGPRPEEDELTLSVRVPRVVLPTFAFMGGIIVIRWRMDGGFLLDVGFPWIEGGIRRWDRAFGAIVTPFQGSGGFYMRRMEQQVLTDGGQRTAMRLGAGLGLQFGLGGAYGDGAFRVTATIGIFIIVEGEALFEGSNMMGIRLIGSVGLLGRASGELNWWVISIRIEVLLIAEARLTFTWGYPVDALPASSTPKKEGSVLFFELTVYASVSASACVGWGPFKVCQGISLSIPIPVVPKINLIGA